MAPRSKKKGEEGLNCIRNLPGAMRRQCTLVLQFSFVVQNSRMLLYQNGRLGSQLTIDEICRGGGVLVCLLDHLRGGIGNGAMHGAGTPLRS